MSAAVTVDRRMLISDISLQLPYEYEVTVRWAIWLRTGGALCSGRAFQRATFGVELRDFAGFLGVVGGGSVPYLTYTFRSSEARTMHTGLFDCNGPERDPWRKGRKMSVPCPCFFCLVEVTQNPNMALNISFYP